MDIKIKTYCEISNSEALKLIKIFVDDFNGNPKGIETIGNYVVGIREYRKGICFYITKDK